MEWFDGGAMSQVSEFCSYWQGAPPKVIFEAGARDCKDTLEFHRIYPWADIWTFECNPETLPACRKAVRMIPEIHLIEKAVCEMSGIVSFHQVDTSKCNNPGASSLYIASGKYPAETYVQNELKVEAVTFEDVILSNHLPGVDMLWLDMQGGELAALESLCDYIDGVKLAMIEVEFQEIYTGQPLFEEVDRFMEWKGFRVVAWPYRDHWSGNAIYARLEHE